MIWGLWYWQAESIIDVKLGEADAGSYKYETMAALLDWWETIKKDKNGKHFHNRQKHFYLFAISVDGILGREALVLFANSSRIMAAKMDEPI